MMAMRICSCCHRPFPPRLFVTGSRRRHLVDAVLAHPDGITSDRIADLIYADDPNGGPEHARRSIWVMINFANKQLAAQGYTIKSTGGPGATYRLLKIAKARAA
jgi:hypothetical protein